MPLTKYSKKTVPAKLLKAKDVNTSKPKPQRTRRSKNTKQQQPIIAKPSNAKPEKKTITPYQHTKTTPSFNIGPEHDASKHMGWRVLERNNGKTMSTYVKMRVAVPMVTRIDHCVIDEQLLSSHAGAPNDRFTTIFNICSSRIPRNWLSHTYTLNERQIFFDEFLTHFETACTLYTERVRALVDEPSVAKGDLTRIGRYIRVGDKKMD